MSSQPQPHRSAKSPEQIFDLLKKIKFDKTALRNADRTKEHFDLFLELIDQTDFFDFHNMTNTIQTQFTQKLPIAQSFNLQLTNPVQQNFDDEQRSRIYKSLSELRGEIELNMNMGCSDAKQILLDNKTFGQAFEQLDSAVPEYLLMFYAFHEEFQFSIKELSSVLLIFLAVLRQKNGTFYPSLKQQKQLINFMQNYNLTIQPLGPQDTANDLTERQLSGLKKVFKPISRLFRTISQGQVISQDQLDIANLQPELDSLTKSQSSASSQTQAAAFRFGVLLNLLGIHNQSYLLQSKQQIDTNNGNFRYFEQFVESSRYPMTIFDLTKNDSGVMVAQSSSADMCADSLVLLTQLMCSPCSKSMREAAKIVNAVTKKKYFEIEDKAAEFIPISKGKVMTVLYKIPAPPVTMICGNYAKNVAEATIQHNAEISGKKIGLVVYASSGVIGKQLRYVNCKKNSQNIAVTVGGFGLGQKIAGVKDHAYVLVVISKSDVIVGSQAAVQQFYGSLVSDPMSQQTRLAVDDQKTLNQCIPTQNIFLDKAGGVKKKNIYMNYNKSSDSDSESSVSSHSSSESSSEENSLELKSHDESEGGCPCSSESSREEAEAESKITAENFMAIGGSGSSGKAKVQVQTTTQDPSANFLQNMISGMVTHQVGNMIGDSSGLLAQCASMLNGQNNITQNMEIIQNNLVDNLLKVDTQNKRKFDAFQQNLQTRFANCQFDEILKDLKQINIGELIKEHNFGAITSSFLNMTPDQAEATKNMFCDQIISDKNYKLLDNSKSLLSNIISGNMFGVMQEYGNISSQLMQLQGQSAGKILQKKKI